MKKAKEYAQEIIDTFLLDEIEPTVIYEKKLFGVLKSLFNEALEIIKTRSIKNNDNAIVAVVSEQNRKWISIVNRVNKEVSEPFRLNKKVLTNIIDRGVWDYNIFINWKLQTIMEKSLN